MSGLKIELTSITFMCGCAESTKSVKICIKHFQEINFKLKEFGLVRGQAKELWDILGVKHEKD